MTDPNAAAPTPRPPDCNAALVLADGTVFWGRGIGATGQRGRRGVLQHRDHRLSGDPDRPLLCRADHHLHLPAYRQCRRQPRGHRDDDPGRRAAWSSAARSPSRRITAPTQPLDAWLKSHGMVGICGGRHAAADPPHPRSRARPTGSSPTRPTGELDIAAMRAEARGLARARRHGPRQGGHLPPEL